MKQFILLSVISVLGSFSLQAQEHFVGYWANEDETQIIKIHKKDKLYFGEIIYRADRPLKMIKDKLVFPGLNRKNKKTLQGSYTDHDLNLQYDATLTLINQDTLKFTGLYAIFYINTNWHRVP